MLCVYEGNRMVCRGRGGLRGLVVAGAAVGTLLSAGAASAAIEDINSWVVQERRFNDFPGTTLTVTDNGFAGLRFEETGFFPDGGSDFANRHVAWLSDDDTTPFAFANDRGFKYSVDINLDAGLDSPAKEAGLFMDSFIGGEGQMIVKTNGEIAAFGSFFPFFSTNNPETFGGQQYSTGSTINLGLEYRPGDGQGGTVPATMQYFVDGVGGEVFTMGNVENGVIPGSQFGVYVQYPPDFFASPPDFGDTLFSNVVFEVLGTVAGLAGDYNDSGSVEQGDLDLVLNNWGSDRTSGFVANTDGLASLQVDQEELDRVLNNWGSSNAPSFSGSAVPEPAAAALLAGLGLALRRRRGMGA